MKVLLIDQIAKVNYKYSFSLANALAKNENVHVDLVIDGKEQDENCSLKKYKLFLLCLLIAPAVSILTGCARPNDEDMVDMLSDAYQCKWIKVGSYEKTDSLPGIWTYVAQYDFTLRFREGEAGAYKFMKGLYNTVPGETDWQKVLQNPARRKVAVCEVPAPTSMS